MGILGSSLRSRYLRDVAAVVTPAEQRIVSEADLAPLPTPVQAYLRYAGVVGRPQVTNLHAKFSGRIRSKPDAPWMRFRADQYSTFAPRRRFFLLEASLYGLPFVAFHRYVGHSATMEVKAVGLFTVVDARGDEMTQSETVTMLNDMCAFAPATLVDADIRWEALDAQRVKATFSNAGHTVSATLHFDDRGALVNFDSDDRYMSSDGKLFERYRWSTPLRDYREYEGVRLASHGDASWALPSGELVYGRFDLDSIRYNLQSPER